PLYQTILYLVYLAFGFPGLSVLLCLMCLAIYALWIKWAGGWRLACLLSPAWAIALLGFRERITLRPDLLTMIFLLLLLLAIDRYRRGRSLWAAAFVVIQWLMVNAHPLFTIAL